MSKKRKNTSAISELTGGRKRHICKTDGVTIIPVLRKTKSLIRAYGKALENPKIKPYYVTGIIPKTDLVTMPSSDLKVLNFAEKYPSETMFFTVILKTPEVDKELEKRQ